MLGVPVLAMVINPFCPGIGTTNLTLATPLNRANPPVWIFRRTSLENPARRPPPHPDAGGPHRCGGHTSPSLASKAASAHQLQQPHRAPGNFPRSFFRFMAMAPRCATGCMWKTTWMTCWALVPGASGMVPSGARAGRLKRRPAGVAFMAARLTTALGIQAGAGSFATAIEHGLDHRRCDAETACMQGSEHLPG